MPFDGGGDEHIGFLGDPGFAVLDDVARLLGGFPVNGAVLVCDGEQEARVHALFVAVGVGFLVVSVPAGDTGDLAAEHLHETNGGILRHISKAFDGGDGPGRIDLQVSERFTHSVNDAVACGFGPALGAATADRFAGEHARGVLTDKTGIFIHHPAHHLGRGSDIRRRDIVAGTDVLPHGAHPAAADLFLLDSGERGRVADHAALAAAEGDIGNRAFPCHPGGKSPHCIEGLVGGEADAALVGSARVIVLDAESLEDTHRTIVHADGDAKGIFPHGPAQDFAHAGVEVEHFSDLVELFLCQFKGIDIFGHIHSPFW